MFDKFKKPKPPLRQVRVDYGICHFCGACVGACPANAIFLGSSHLCIGDTCTHCERCISACPLGALSLIDQFIVMER
jgi:ferredoxin